jgi:hypothetical protein
VPQEGIEDDLFSGNRALFDADRISVARHEFTERHPFEFLHIGRQVSAVCLDFHMPSPGVSVFALIK